MSLTIAIPTYNRPGYLDATLTSLVKQPWREDTKILALVNQPTEGYGEVVERFKAHPMVSFVFQRTHQPAAAQADALLSAVDTELVIGLCDDDELDAAIVNEYSQILLDNPTLQAAFAPVHYLNKVTGKEFLYNAVDETTVVRQGDYDSLLSFLARNEHFPELGIFRTKTLQRVNTRGTATFLHLVCIAGCIHHGAIVFGQRPFYRFILAHDQEDNRIHLGSSFAKSPDFRDRASAGIDLLIERALLQYGNRITPEQASEFIANGRKLFASRLREAYYNYLSEREYVEAMEVRRRLRAYLVEIDDDAWTICLLAAIDTAHRSMRARSWLDSLVVFRMGGLSEHFRYLNGVIEFIDEAEGCRKYAANSLIIATRQDAHEIESFVPPAHLMILEDVVSEMGLL